MGGSKRGNSINHHKMKITKEQFEQFESLRFSGVCNMFDTRSIQSMTDLSPEEIKEIRDNYGELSEEYDPVEVTSYEN